MAKTGIEGYVKTYLRNKATELGADGFAKWVSQNAADTARIYSDRISDAYSDYARSLPDYGSAAERLKESGLSSSGYASYLEDSARATLYSRQAAAKTERVGNEARKTLGYEEYLKDTEAANDSLYKSTYSELISSGTMDAEHAYLRASEAGLSDKKAHKLAAEVTEQNRSKMRMKVLERVLDMRLSSTDTEIYAMGLGMPTEDVKLLATLADRLQNLIKIDGNAGRYLQTLKEKEIQNKEN